MQVVIDDAGSIAILRLSGRLDISGVEAVATPLATMAEAKSGLVVDLSQVTSVGSMGIRHLVAAARVLARRGGRLIVLNPNDLVTDVLINAGVMDMLHVTRSEREARAAATSTGSTLPSSS
jgi:anti-sigma B factor antagonist